MTYSLIAAFYDLTGLTDRHIADLLGIPRSTAQAYRTGKLDENLTPEQRAILIARAHSYRQEVYEAVAKMELFS